MVIVYVSRQLCCWAVPTIRSDWLRSVSMLSPLVEKCKHVVISYNSMVLLSGGGMYLYHNADDFKKMYVGEGSKIR